VATERDLVEAQSFVRRRLLAALVSRAPGDREAEGGSHGRAAMVGLALALLLIAISALGRLLSGAPGDAGSEPPPAAGPAEDRPGGLRGLRGLGGLGGLAEDRGFEPLRACTQPAFQASAIGH
jgi:Type VII secretion system ESX-1, transport TM domain B